MNKVDILILEKIKKLKEMSFGVSFISMNGLGRTDFEEKRIFINDSLALIAKQYIFFHEYFHVVANYKNGDITNANYNTSEIEEEDRRAVELLLEYGFDFEKLFELLPFIKVKKLYGEIKKINV